MTETQVKQPQTQFAEEYFTLDTSVCIGAPDKIFNSFRPNEPGKKNHLVIPWTVIEEIDSLKREPRTKRDASLFSSLLWNYVGMAETNLDRGVEISPGLDVRVSAVGIESLEKKLGGQMDSRLNDNLILATAYELHKKYENDKSIGVEFVTTDKLQGSKASALGITTREFEDAVVIHSINEAFTGWEQVEVSEENLNLFLEGVSLKPSKFKNMGTVFPNEYFILSAPGVEIPKVLDGTIPLEEGYAVGIYRKDSGTVEKILPYRQSYLSPLGIGPKNLQQAMAIDALLRRDIGSVVLYGTAGSGKTLLALAAGLHQTLPVPNKKNKHLYGKTYVARPNVGMGPEVGFLPGDLTNKTAPLMRPIFENIENPLAEGLIERFAAIKEGYRGKKDAAKPHIRPEQLVGNLLNGDPSRLEIETMFYMQGITFYGGFVIVDEAQNNTIYETKLVGERLDDGSKIVLTGDPSMEQNFKKGNSSTRNGIVAPAEAFKEQDRTATIFLPEGERGFISNMYAKHL